MAMSEIQRAPTSSSVSVVNQNSCQASGNPQSARTWKYPRPSLTWHVTLRAGPSSSSWSDPQPYGPDAPQHPRDVQQPSPYTGPAVSDTAESSHTGATGPGVPDSGGSQGGEVGGSSPVAGHAGNVSG